MSDDKPTLFERLMDDAGKGIAPARPAVVMSRLHNYPGLKWWAIRTDGTTSHGADREWLLTMAHHPNKPWPRD